MKCWKIKVGNTLRGGWGTERGWGGAWEFGYSRFPERPAEQEAVRPDSSAPAACLRPGQGPQEAKGVAGQG